MLRRSQTSASSSTARTNTNNSSRNSKTSGGLLSASGPAQPMNTKQHPFLLPSSDFFVGERDSLLLSESDIFHTAAAAVQKQQQKLQLAPKDKENEAPAVRRGRPAMSSLPSSSPAHCTIAALHPPPLVNVGMKRAAPGKVPIAPQPPKIPHLADVSSVASSSLFYSAVNKATSPRFQAPQHGNVSSGAFINQSLLDSMVDKDSANKTDKGLRHFSAKVCSKVEEKGCTTYNEVADELVREFDFDLEKCDHKNIRRRVYDALNVLMAIDIIEKDKKEIRWLGLPNQTVDDLRALEAEKAAIHQRIAEKTRGLREVLRRCISLKNLIDRNAEMERTRLESSSGKNDRLHLPFILISAARDCHVHCEMLEDRTQYFFEFNTAFQINEDTEVMRLLGLDTARVEQIKSFFPRELISHVLLLCLSSSSSAASSSALLQSHQPNYSAATPGGSLFAPIGIDPLQLSSLPPSSPM